MSSSDPNATLDRLRLLLLAVLALGLIGTGCELWLLGHIEDVWQWTPLVLGGLALAAIGGFRWARGRRTLAALRAVLALVALSGPVGMVQHLRGNIAFERELSPSIAAWDLIREAMTGATPALAPGTMTLLGLLGLAATYRQSFPDTGDPR